MTPRRVLTFLLLLASVLVISACVPESDIERVAGTSSNDNDIELTPDDALPEIDELQLRLLSLETFRSAGRVAVEIAIGAGSHDDIRLADTAQVEWSDGEITDALPLPGANIIIETSRSDPDEVLEPVRIYLSNVTRHVGTDSEAEVTSEEITTQWGTFTVLGIDRTARPPGWKMEYQAAGSRWIGEARLIDDDGRYRYGDNEDLQFTSEFVPVSAALQFGTEISNLEDALPMRAEVDIRQAIPDMVLDL
jgi:hypothetical protein